MKRLVLIVAVLIGSAGPGRAEVQGPAFEAQVAEGLSGLSRGALKITPMAAPQPAAAAVDQSADYCVASFASAAEGAPKHWFRIACGGAEPFSSPSRWCWALKDRRHRECVGKIVEGMQTLMRGKGYEDVGRYKNGGETATYYLFQKTAAVRNRDKGHCLVHRIPVWKSGFGGVARIDYKIDCGENALTSLTDAEADKEGINGILAYMQKTGHALKGSLDEKRGFRKLVFQRQ